MKSFRILIVIISSFPIIVFSVNNCLSTAKNCDSCNNFLISNSCHHYVTTASHCHSCQHFLIANHCPYCHHCLATANNCTIVIISLLLIIVFFVIVVSLLLAIVTTFIISYKIPFVLYCRQTDNSLNPRPNSVI